MKKLYLSLLLFNPITAFAGSLVINVPDVPEPMIKNVVYQCDTGANKEKVEATYLNAGNISLVDFKWKGEQIVAANVIAASGSKYAGAQYIWWVFKNEVTLIDLINDPEEKKSIFCKVEEKK
ncbi:conserved exported protein of unknown function [Bartonella clarridgeiae 73]|uniref:C-type lysozyme inhibitor domain-containing protein n=1 Tax=Bartonella clarridgeiae (strain CCUG 45776 / CIP 104772 / 73) TaxID=696125 RepID=E6YJJ5_BARC7|nr:MliC family protein [Bartonella clarridgeiae]WCR55736.1 MAG: Inhibitor of vertebrate c-type lysozyme outer membrane [Bartonella clarridgeiae]CBI77033.1 conserved exported protein of unknown function [Bartonella clarridgeiae 73]